MNILYKYTKYEVHILKYDKNNMKYFQKFK